MGRPDDPETWIQLDDVLDHVYRYENGKGLRISMSFVDDGGHFTQYTRWEASRRIGKRLFPRPRLTAIVVLFSRNRPAS